MTGFTSPPPFQPGVPTYNSMGQLVTGIDHNALNANFALMPAAISGLATIQALSAEILGQPQCYALGHTLTGDGGEGLFVYNSTDTTSADNGGTILVDQGGRRWYRNTNGDSISVKWFGATGSGTTDDTTAIHNCITYCIANGLAVYFPAGTYLYSSLTVSNSGANFKMSGAGRGVTFLKTSLATGAAFSVAAATSCISDITFGATVARTAGAHIVTACNIGNIFNVGLDGFFVGIQGNDNGGVWRDILTTNPAAGATGMIVNGYSNALVIDSPWAYQGSNQASVGIQIVNSGAVQINDANIVGQGIDLFINPGTGQTVASVFAQNCFFDTASRGIAINPTGTGNVVRCKFMACWTCSHSLDGVLIENSGTGTVAGIEFVNHISSNNTGYGFNLAGGSGVSFIGGTFAANNVGIGIEAGVSDFTIMGVQAGSYGGFTGNTSYGIIVAAGASNRYVIKDNRLNGNTTAPMSDAGTGMSKSVSGNIPYNPIAPNNLSVGASPFSYTNTTGGPMSVMIFSGTVSVVQINGVQVSSATNTSVVLAPNDYVTVTYSATPTIQTRGLA